MYQNINIKYYYDNKFGYNLYRECFSRGFHRIIEVGNESSFTTLVFAQAIRDLKKNGHVHSFDIKDYDRKSFVRESKRLACQNIVVNFHLGKCPEIFNNINLNGYDMIYIDINNNSDKIYEVVNICSVFKWILDGGVILFEGGHKSEFGCPGPNREHFHPPPLSLLRCRGINYRVLYNEFPGFSIIDNESIDNYAINQ